MRRFGGDVVKPAGLRSGKLHIGDAGLIEGGGLAQNIRPCGLPGEAAIDVEIEIAAADQRIRQDFTDGDTIGSDIERPQRSSGGQIDRAEK